MSNPTKRKTQANAGHPPAKTGLWLLLAGGLLILAAALFAVLSGGRSASAPSLAVDQETIDLGPVKLGQTVSASFRLTNTGDAPLRFSKPPYIEVREGC